MDRRLKRPLPWIVAALAWSCHAAGSDYAPPELALPERWQAGLSAEDAGAPAPAWSQLGDPRLDAYLERACAGNLDLVQALARVRAAQALRGVAAAGRWPTLDGRASYERRGESANTPFGQFVPDSEVTTLGLDAGYEVDLFGRVARSVEAADADLAARVEDARAVELGVSAETARSYVDLCAFQRRVELARTNVALQEETLSLVRGRFEAGLVGERDLAQALTNVETTRARLPPLEVGLRAAENRLAVLLGEPPGVLAVELAEPRAIPVPPLAVAAGIPADLLRRRPDVRRAERELAAEHARIGVAEGDLYPRLSLAGSLGLAAEKTGDLLDDDSDFYSLGPSLRWSLFDGGRLRGRVRAQEARAEEAFAHWESLVLGALEETENALTLFVREQSRRFSLASAATQARRSVELARSQYTEGLSDFQSVLDSERALALLEDELAQSDAAIASAFVDVVAALGGP